jgi:hypothetical protein
LSEVAKLALEQYNRLVNEPIDAVYTWVDDADPAWAARKRDVLASLGADADELHASSTSASRFKNRDELRYSLRSLERYAPFVRNVYLVTDQQVPHWLDERRVKVIDHRDIFLWPEHLPTFNSRAIECHLHRIEGLSERFLYLNDDVLLCGATAPTDYFDEQGRAIVHLDSREVVWDQGHHAYDRPVHVAMRNTSALLEANGYDRIVHRIDHVPYALNRSELKALSKRFQSETHECSSHRFRDPRDIKLTSGLFQYVGLASNTAVESTGPGSNYIKLGNRHSALISVLKKLVKHHISRSTRGVKYFSANDAGRLPNSLLLDFAIRAYFLTAYPNRSRYEKH